MSSPQRLKLCRPSRSLLDDGEAFLSSADSALVLAPDAVKKVSGFEGLRYRAAFPAAKPPGSNFYPADMSKQVSCSKERWLRVSNPAISVRESFVGVLRVYIYGETVMTARAGMSSSRGASIGAFSIGEYFRKVPSSKLESCLCNSPSSRDHFVEPTTCQSLSDCK